MASFSSSASSRLTSGELTYILNDCNAKVFITSHYKADQAAEIQEARDVGRS